MKLVWDHPAALVLVGVAVAAALLLALVLGVLNRSGPRSAVEAIAHTLVTAYLVLLAAIVLWPFPTVDPSICSVPSLHSDPEYRPLKFVMDAYVDARDGLVVSAILIVGEAMANVALLVPAGLYLLSVWRWRLGMVSVACTALSVVVETTQLTGVWGLYPCAYRIFSVDDLITNTLGAPSAYLIVRVAIRLSTARWGR